MCVCVHITEHSLHIRKDYNIFNDMIFCNCKLNEAVVDPMALCAGIVVFPIARVDAHRINERISYGNLGSSILLGANGYLPMDGLWLLLDFGYHFHSKFHSLLVQVLITTWNNSSIPTSFNSAKRSLFVYEYKGGEEELLPSCYSKLYQ